MRRCNVARACLSVPRSPSACWAQRLGMLVCLSPTPLSSSTSITREGRGERGPLGLPRSLLLSPGRHRTCSLPLARSPPSHRKLPFFRPLQAALLTFPIFLPPRLVLPNPAPVLPLALAPSWPHPLALPTVSHLCS